MYWKTVVLPCSGFPWRWPEIPFSPPIRPRRVIVDPNLVGGKFGPHYEGMQSDNDQGPRVRVIPEGDDRERLVCPDCGHVAYENPKVVTGAVCLWQEKILMCRRAIEPRRGYWTIPAGFLELEESTAEGAAREVWEEARARISITGLIGIYEIPHISQIYVVHRADMTGPNFAPGPESEEVSLFAYEDLPWPEIAFPSIRWSLERYREGGPPVTGRHEP